MTVTAALARWSKKSNRKRLVETMARALPWLAAGAAIVLFASERFGEVAAIACGGVIGAAIIVFGARRQRSVRHRPATIARVLDVQHATSDLLQTALAIEAKPAREDLDDVVIARATEAMPAIAPLAVAPIRMRPSPIGGVAAVAASALLLLTGADPRGSEREPDAAAERARAKSSELAKAIDELAKDESLSPEARAKLKEAKEALERAAAAKTGKAALAAMSEAQRLLDEAAPHLDQPKASELAKMSNKQLADEMAKAAKTGDGAKLNQLAREAMRRAALGDKDAQELAQAIADAAKKAGGGDPWGDSGFPNTPEGKRLAELAKAAESLRSGDSDAASKAMSELAKKMGMGKSGAQMAKLDAMRRALAGMKMETRDALNGREMADARAEAARAAAHGATRTGKGMGSGSGSGSGSGMGKGMGMGSGKGDGKGMGTGTGPGKPGDGQPQNGNAMSVLAPGGVPGGKEGSSGAHGGTTKSGAEEPETVTAEDVNAPPPQAMSPEGVIRAIAEHAQGDHRATDFGPVRDHYAAIAESAIHRDEIPLTRRDFIQRYFEALRNREEP